MTPYRKPERFFEDAGVVDPGSAYHVDLDHVGNTKGQDIKTMVDMGRYFSIFAPRQSGKTTFFKDFCSRLAEDATYVPILLSFQDYKNISGEKFYSLIYESLLGQIVGRLARVDCPQQDHVKAYVQKHPAADHISFRKLFEGLNDLIEKKKIVIFIDEFDGIPRSELENFLTTLRELYQEYKGRKDKALYSVGLVGIRNITKLIVGGVSPFNIADQVKLPPFTLKNVRDLYGQYTAETNQPFMEEAVKEVFDQTAGQPWLVNRIGTILTVDIRRETVTSITTEDVDKAVEVLLYEENSHFDNITEKAKQYKETFMDVVFDGVEYIPGDEEQSLLLTHGLIKAEGRELSVSNPIYKKRFTRTFFRDIADRVDPAFRPYYLPDGTLNMERVLADFEKYIARIGAAAFYSTRQPMEVTGKFQLTAWLYQFVPEGEGELFYESKTGLGIMDIMLIHRGLKYIVELKIRRYSGTIDEALEQLTEKYLAPERVDRGYIVVFDPATKVGELCTPGRHRVGGKDVLSFNIGIGR
ncbi:MAG TPA: hypothetical protein HPP58_08820 [Deltaproteobacteria bacterium]|nr:hypothetical protein [Deltaproteobacteria bacterium]